MTKKKIAIVGASGYTGMESVRILKDHPGAEIVAVAAGKRVGNRLSTIMGPNAPDMEFCDLDSEEITKSEVIFSCLPHCTVMMRVAEWREAGKTVIDLSSDFRLKDPGLYKQWYNIAHHQPDLLNESVYGLPEVNRVALKDADLIACPGCYPTASILGIVPALVDGFITHDVIVNAVSGVSGAGRNAKEELTFCEVNENMYGYALPKHRHTPEIEQELTRAAEAEVKVTFAPHLGPFNRGIYATIYADLKEPRSDEELMKLYKEFYASSPFVKVSEENPQLKNVRGTNYCHIRPMVDLRTERLIAISAIDNLVKGAAGQAVQCFNIRFGFDETTGLEALSV